MFHVRLARFVLLTKDIVNVDGSTVLDAFVHPWLAGEAIVWDGRRWPASSTKLTIYEGPRLTTAQRGFGAWLKVVEYGEDITDALLARRDFGRVVRSDATTSRSASSASAPAPATTADLRAATGLDRSAREVILQRLEEAGVPPMAICAAFFREVALSGFPDYLTAVAEVWGGGTASSVDDNIRRYIASHIDESRVDWQSAEAEAAALHWSAGLLLEMPEPDFLTAVELGLQWAPDPRARAGGLTAQVNNVCLRRGVHFRLEGLPPRFVWVKDAATQREVIAPALQALADPRLAKGPAREYATARAELRAGTPAARKQAVAEACNAVESTMKVVLDSHRVLMTGKEAAQRLFELLRDNGIVDKATETLILSPARFGNQRGRHGAGPVAHAVAEAEAESVVVVVAAANAISLLSSHLPPAP